MAVTQLQGPRNVGMDIVNVILSMQGIKERRKYRELQESQLALSKKQLGISQAVESRAAKTFAAEKPIRKLAGVEARGRKRLVKRFGRADKALATAKREYEVAKTLGDKGRIDTTKAKLSAVRTLRGKSAEMFETILFADEIAKDSRAQLAIAQQQALSDKSTIQQMDMMFRSKMQQLGSQYDAIAGAITPENLPAGIAAMNAVKAGDMDTFGKMHSSMMATTAAKKREPEERRFTPSKLNTEVVAEFGSGSYQQMLVAEAANLPYPDVRSVYKDAQWPRSNWRKILTREEARTKGAEDEWLKATPIDLERMGDRTQPKQETKPTKKKTVKELADEKVKKTTAAKGKVAKKPAAKKPAAKKTAGGYTVGQVINRAGKRYKITGFDTDGEPLVVEIK